LSRHVVAVPHVGQRTRRAAGDTSSVTMAGTRRWGGHDAAIVLSALEACQRATPVVPFDVA
jgi:hypothetical protein